MRYFDHDTHAADDDRIMALRLRYGGAAVDCYWTLLEKMYRDERPVNLFGSDGETNVETESVSHRLCIGVETLKEYVSTMLQIGLFEGDMGCITSERAMRNIEGYRERVETARQNGKKGGRKPTKKPKPNRVGSKVETNVEPSRLQEKKRKGIGLDKPNQIPSASVGVAVADATPPSAPTAPICPLCSSPVRFDAHDGVWRCDLCGDVKEPAYREVEKR